MRTDVRYSFPSDLDGKIECNTLPLYGHRLRQLQVERNHRA